MDAANSSFVGLDVGGSSIKPGGIPMQGNHFFENEPLRTPPDPVNFLELLKTLPALTNPNLGAFGIGIPGPVDLNGNLGQCPALPEWSNFPLGTELKKYWSVPFIVGNDGNFAAKAEYHALSPGFLTPKTMVLATVGTGVGGGIVIQGKLLEGRVAEIGHLQVDTGSLLALNAENRRNYFPFPNFDLRATCGCGCQGHLEAFVGKAALAHYFPAIDEFPEDHPLRQVDRSEWANQVFNLAQCGDELICKILFAQAFVLGMGFANLAATLDPDLFVIGGGYSKIKGQEYVDRYLFAAMRGFGLVAKPDYTLDRRVQFAKTGNSAGWMGAALCAKELVAQ